MAKILDSAAREWSRNATPLPSSLCDPGLFKLTDLFILACPRLNPAAVQLTNAILGLNKVPAKVGYKASKVLRGSNDFLEAKKLANLIRLVLNRYREIAKHDAKMAMTLAKAMTLRNAKRNKKTITQKTKQQNNKTKTRQTNKN